LHPAINENRLFLIWDAFLPLGQDRIDVSQGNGFQQKKEGETQELAGESGGRV
jgi:hypothetical protein